MEQTHANRLPYETRTPDLTVRLRDGRRLGWAEYGDPDGHPVLYFHGWPGSRVEAKLFTTLAGPLGCRVIAVDRPGIGLSDFQHHRSLLDWPDDIRQLADHLGFERFSVFGLSGGGPYAAACAYRIPERVSSAALVSAMGPVDDPDNLRDMGWWNVFLLQAARRATRLSHLLFVVTADWVRRFPGMALRVGRAMMPKPDGLVLSRPEFKMVFAESIREVLRSGSRGPVWDGLLYARPWGFRLEDIRIPVHLWHGEKDLSVPAAMGRSIARAIPDCRARFVPNEGHVSLIDRYVADILRAMQGGLPQS